MYDCLIERIADREQEISESFYDNEELAAFRAYVILAETDETKRRNAFFLKRTIYDFTTEEVARFDAMQDVLTEFYRLLDDNSIEIESILLTYSDGEMMEYRQYRKLWLAQNVPKKDERDFVENFETKIGGKIPTSFLTYEIASSHSRYLI